jgi:hypothetical protein
VPSGDAAAPGFGLDLSIVRNLRWQGWGAFMFLEYAAGLGLDNVQFSERSTGAWARGAPVVSAR